MDIKKKFLISVCLSLYCVGLIANNLRDDENERGDNCDELYNKYVLLKRENKTTEAEKIIKLLEVKDCNEKKATELIYHVRSTQKKPVKTTVLTLSDEMVTFGYQGSEHVVTVSGGGKWKAVTESDWCSFQKESNRIIIQCPENPSISERKCTIVVTSGKMRKEISIINEGAPVLLRSSFSSLSFPSEGGTNEVDIYANTNWKVKRLPDWITIRPENNHIVFLAEPNKQTEERTGKVTICTNDFSHADTIKVYQGVHNDLLTFSKNDISFGPDGGDEYIKVFTNVGTWVFDDLPWCHVTRIGEDSLKIHCDANEPIDQARKCCVKMKGLQELGINITQEAKPFQYLVPSMGIGGKALSLGVTAGYVIPMISASSNGDYTGSVVNYSLGNSDEQVSYKPSGGFTFGVFADIRLYKNIYLIAGLNYHQYSYKNEFKSDVYRQIYQTESYYLAGNTQNRYEEEYKLSQLEVPILGSYRFPVKKMNHVQVNVGPVLNYGITAKMEINGYTSSKDTYFYAIENGKSTNNLYDKRIQEIYDRGRGSGDLYKKEVDYWVVDKNGNESNKYNKLSDAPLKKINIGLRLGVVYEYYGFDIGAEFTYMITNMGNNKYWNNNRWEIFDQHANTLLSGYQQRNHYLGIKLGYTFRY